MPMTEEAKAVAFATLVPGACYVASGLVFTFDKTINQSGEWFKSLNRPSWAIPAENAIAISMFTDVLTVPPFVYATTLVWKEGGGFKNHDSKLALTGYALLFPLGTVFGLCALKKRSLNALTWCGAVWFCFTLGVSHLYYKVEKKAGYLTLPLLGAIFYNTMMTYRMSIMNEEKQE